MAETIYLADLIGKPYKENGRDLTGFDCYGLAIEVTKRFGKPLNDVIYNNHDIELSSLLVPTLNVKTTEKIKAGTILEMNFRNELHIGVCLNEKEFIHTTAKQGVRISKIGVIPIIEKYEVI